MVNQYAGKTIQIIERSSNRVIDTHYKAFYTKFRGKLYIWKAGVKMEQQKGNPLGKYDLSQYTWRFA